MKMFEQLRFNKFLLEYISTHKGSYEELVRDGRKAFYKLIRR